MTLVAIATITFYTILTVGFIAFLVGFVTLCKTAPIDQIETHGLGLASDAYYNQFFKDFCECGPWEKDSVRNYPT